MELVNKKDFAKAIQLQRYRLAAAAGPLMRITGITKVNKWYDKIHTRHGLDFIEDLFNLMDVSVEVDPEDLRKIPRNGAFITVSNHPFGMMDGLVLLKLIASQRPDFKVMANFLLQYVPQLKEYFISVNPLENHPGAYSNLKGMKQALEHVANGHPLGIFPAGEVSTFQPKTRTISDRAWQKPALKLIQKAGVPVVPVYFQGTNSPLFHLVGLLHPALRTVALPSEMIRKTHTRLKVRIGTPITVKELQLVPGTERLGRYLRARTYSLGSGLEVNHFFKPRFEFPKLQQPIAHPVPQHVIRAEVEALGSGRIICSQGEFDVYCASAQEIPNTLQEIGRLREITFRSAGEGTGHAKDLDEFDLYYLHLFLWDRSAQQVAGAYRMGKGDEIMSKYGRSGFYTDSVFRIRDGLNPILERAIELGRSFILEAYQKKRLPLFLLWKGIYQYLQHNPRYRYLVGPVSISNDYSTVSKQLIVALIRKFYFDDHLAQFISPRQRFEPRIREVDIDALLEGFTGDLKQADKLLEDIEPAHFRLPVLLKKYIRQNARIICFNVDPKFNNALDGFMVLDLTDLPPETGETMGD